MNKKAIAILGAIFILIVGTLGFLIYSKYSGQKTGTPTTTQVQPTPTGTTDVSNSTPTPSPTVQSVSNFVKLTDDIIVSPTLFFNGKGVTYFDRQGQLYQSTLASSSTGLTMADKKSLAIQAKSNITKVLWPAKGDDFIAEFSSSSGKKSWSYYNSKTGVYTDLPPQITSIDWMPNGDKIAYIWFENNKSTLNISDPDSKNWKQIADMWENDDIINISPDGQSILYFQNNPNNIVNTINFTNIEGKVWKPLIQDGQNLGILWSPDSKKFLFAKRDPNSQKFQLWYYDLVTSQPTNLGLFTTVEKTLWDKDSKTVYAAVPVKGTAGDDSLTVDTFYKIDTNTLQKKEFQSGNLNVDGRDLFLSLNSDKLFFRDAQAGGMYYIDLTK